MRPSPSDQDPNQRSRRLEANVSFSAASSRDLVADEEVTARLAAEDGERAVERVRAALGGEEFTVAEPQPESQQAASP
jgi:hypothetical protein